MNIVSNWEHFSQHNTDTEEEGEESDNSFLNIDTVFYSGKDRTKQRSLRPKRYVCTRTVNIVSRYLVTKNAAVNIGYPVSAFSLFVYNLIRLITALTKFYFGMVCNISKWKQDATKTDSDEVLFLDCRFLLV